MSLSLTRWGAWYDFAGSSIRIRGSSLGRFSFPIQVSSSLVLPLVIGFFIANQALGFGAVEFEFGGGFLQAFLYLFDVFAGG